MDALARVHQDQFDAVTDRINIVNQNFQGLRGCEDLDCCSIRWVGTGRRLFNRQVVENCRVRLATMEVET